MKIIWTDGLNRDSVADRVVVTDIATEKLGNILLKVFLANEDNTEKDWYLLVEDSYPLKRGMEDLV
jgi:hypothetical protein